MKFRRSFPFKESLLLTLPLLIFLGVAVTHRKVATHQKKGTFKLLMGEALLTPFGAGGARAAIPNTYPIQVTIYLTYTGTRPDWWGDNLISSSRVEFIAKNQSRDGAHMGGYSPLRYDSRSKCYTFDCWGQMPEDTKFGRDGRCHIKSRLMCPYAPFKSYAKVETSIPIWSMPQPAFEEKSQ